MKTRLTVGGLLCGPLLCKEYDARLGQAPSSVVGASSKNSQRPLPDVDEHTYCPGHPDDLISNMDVAVRRPL